MTVHFAAARTAAGSPLARALRQRRPVWAANDNDEPQVDDQLLRASLKHFAEHGLRAAQEAKQKAEEAFFAGDRESYQWWLGVCRMLDRRMARQLENSNSQG